LRPQDVIRRKRDRQELSREEIASFVRGVVRGDWADYQVSALLMAVFLNGMTDHERHALTEEMLHSGEVLDFSDIDRPKVDKHSTGGVGDKTSLILAPLAAACGVCVPMISGRGLGHTGGTLDKLEAIPGYRVNLSLAEFRALLKQTGYAMTGQTAELAPADKKIYALRDATATIEAIPLIVASIMSKKLAAGLDALVLDVKTGTGAFMRETEDSIELARALVATGNSCGVRTEALITDMNQPLGSAVGNALETKECIDILRGEVDDYTRPVLDLSVELAARMVALANIEPSLEEARLRVLKAFESGAALELFRENVEAQGGDPRVCDNPASLMPLTPHVVEVESPRTGFVTRVDAAEIGFAVGAIGGGRARVEDRVDPAVGYLAQAKIGDHLKEGSPLGVIYCRNEAQAAEAATRIRDSYTIDDRATEALPALIKEVIS
jgi:pyrimidine-nucleoside phosphorylase